MNRSVWQPFWEFLANCVIGGIAFIVIGLIIYSIGLMFGADLGKIVGVIIIFGILTGGAIINDISGIQSAIKRFIDSVIIRIAQNTALKYSPHIQQSSFASYFTLVSKAISGIGIIAFFVTILSYYLKYYSGGKDLTLNENLDNTIYFSLRAFLIALPFICGGIIYLGKIKPILPPPITVQTIGGQQGSMSGGTVNVSNQRPPRKP